jgi:CRISPR system Cascade subunit CasE
VLSKNKPRQDHNLLNVETKPFAPQINEGMHLSFCLRANPVVTRNNKRSDVLMDAKFHAKKQGVPAEKWWDLQEKAAQEWLVKQGVQRGFSPVPNLDNLSNVVAHQQQRFIRQEGQSPITFSWVDYSGFLKVTEPETFLNMLCSGLGKSKSLGCGLLMVKRG